ncbi:hypothetical protein E0K89_015405 [Aquicoccus sp. SCR17]|nr:hypothetical protein [Carideicomes alvinocaridis]
MAERGFMTPRRAMAGILLFQLGLAAFLFAGDLRTGLSLRAPDPQAPAFQQPVRPGDQRRTYEPRPAREGLPVSEPMPERLVLTRENGDLWRLEGMIAPGDAERIIGQLTEDMPARLTLNSSGGSVQDALSLGRRLREAGMEIEMGAQDVCLSACPYLLAGGSERRVDRRARVGLHQHYFGESTILPAFVAVENIQRGQGEVMAYLDEMGVDPMVMTHALGTPPDEIYLLVPDELTRYRMATEITGD